MFKLKWNHELQASGFTAKFTIFVLFVWGHRNIIVPISHPLIGHFQVALNLILKARLSVKFLLWKSVFVHVQTKLIFT